PVPSGGRGLATVSSRGISVARPIEFTETRGDTLTDASKRALDDLAIELNNNPQVRKVRVNAHTDARGVPDELVAVSERQARSVKSYLVSRGVDAERVQSKGYGAERPIAPNLTSRGRAKNRRVEFLVLEAD
ncbi:MAG: OmpA family protein, partial [Myxococcales bacterium]|nr:OmpA family protein [Myxococcales bacterium]